MAFEDTKKRSVSFGVATSIHLKLLKHSGIYWTIT